MNPYKSMPARQFWSRAVSQGYDPASIGTLPKPLIARDDQVVTAGSCFAANLVPYLEDNGLTYLRTETRHPVFAHLPADNFSYDKFSAAFGNIYTVRQLLQLLQRCTGAFKPIEDRWHVNGQVIDPFRPGLRYPARSDREFDLLTAQHLTATRAAFERCTVFIFTLGLTEAWVSQDDGAVFPACPGTITGTFDPARHAFKNFNVAEVLSDLEAALTAFRTLNPTARVILTVSPVPLVATASGQHVLAATVYSKSVLRVAAEHGAAWMPNVVYFPSYEIVASPASPERFFEADRRSVLKDAIDTVMAAFLDACATGEATSLPDTAPVTAAAALSALVASVECEEAAQDLG